MNYDKGLVSVIIPCFNQCEFLSEAIESILAQTYTNWECIIVNDGSDDQTESIANLFVKRDSRIRYIYQVNRGVSVARNTGFKASTGEFIQFLDGDDFVSPDKFKMQVDFFNQNPAFDITYAKFSHYYNHKALFEQYTYKTLNEYPLEDFLFGWDGNVGVPIHAPLFRRKIWDADEFPFQVDFNYRYEDLVFWIVLCLKKCRFNYMDRTLAYYRIHDKSFGSSLNQSPVNGVKAIMYISNIIPENLKEKFLDERIEFYFNRYYKFRLEKEIFNSTTWRLAKTITGPLIFLIPKTIKKRLRFKN